MRQALLWFRALRAPFFAASAMLVVVGSAAAWRFGAPRDWAAFAFALVGVVALHAGANLANDYFDHVTGSDAANPCHNAFSGGSRVIQEGLIPARKILAASWMSFVVAAGCAAYLEAVRGGWEIPVLGCAGLALGFFYTAPPRLSYLGLGEAAVFLAFGPLTTGGAYFVQAGRLEWAGFSCGVPVGLFVAAILVVNEFPDFDADKAAGKKTLIVRLGLGRGLFLCGAIYAAAYGVTAAIVAAGAAPQAAWWTFATAPPAAFADFRLWRRGRGPARLKASSAAGILTHLAYSVILAAAYLVGGA